MSLLTGSCQAEIPASIERCWELVADIERAPEWQRTLAAVEVVERDAEGRPLICDTVNDARLMKVRCRVRVSYTPPGRLAFALEQSGDLDAMDGGWQLEALGPERTRAIYTLAVDPGRIGLLARPLERAIRPLVMGHQADELAAAVAARP
ncbi:MAG TPA: SRPBCC family protein [Solirubrobacteraceae bacterium]|jgi:ribosome-associated toxin RatA of RatAB toxin-antitoxin module